VGYAYGDAAPVLDEVTLDVPIGRTIAVVGPTGSGKSTLAGILVRLVDPTDGTVLYDDLDLRTLRQGEVSSAAALVPQQTFLFDDTVRGNIALGGDFTDEEVWAALRTAQGERFVRALPRGLDTVVGERGTTLSGGQRQRLALARAVVRRPRLLLLDDATSSVDPSVEQAILAGLARTTGSATATSVLVVAYRRATIALADEVVFVDEGRVVARGPHEVLLAEVDGYRALVTAYEQAEAEVELADDLDAELDAGARDDREPAA
jgi:ABC-type multidrug transport system fused ATPase/permease subunit